ncbi:hypothetical protein T492DRAFT_832946 [Pavlovales sp. CCMP2436]|nr:hypothetical protein T492DRAFT_832946 [Pavlovales sp. CCMP2436]
MVMVTLLLFDAAAVLCAGANVLPGMAHALAIASPLGLLAAFKSNFCAYGTALAEVFKSNKEFKTNAPACASWLKLALALTIATAHGSSPRSPSPSPSPSPTPSSICAELVTESRAYGGKCYWLSSSGNWRAALASCQAKASSASLARVDDSFEHEWIRNDWAVALNIVFWLGASDLAREGGGQLLCLGK